MIKIELLNEPKIEFAEKFLCEDPKVGITVTGFYSLSNKSHKSEINYAIIGTKKEVELLTSWITSFTSKIEASSKSITIDNEVEIDDGEIVNLFSEEDEMEHYDTNISENEDISIQNKKLNPDFIGFNKETSFKCEFVNDPTNNISIKETEINTILGSKIGNKELLKMIVELYTNTYINMIENSYNKPSICFIVISSEVYKKLASIPFGKQWLNLRRALKANILSVPKSTIPVQIILEDTITEKKKSMQDKSMVAWNFAVAQYFKNDGCIPWALTNIDKNTCFIGISFHRVLNTANNLMRSSVAQAFNREGKGLVFVGKQFEWDTAKTKVPSPHLKYEYAKELIKKILNGYKTINKHTPSRIVIHKTTEFWDSYINQDYAEIEGFTDGINDLLGNDVEIDFVAIRTSKIKLYRERGKLPVLRGTLLSLDQSKGVLYTTGYIPYYATYPGIHIPLGLQIDCIGESSLRTICEEVLALTKLNFNNCNYYDSLPITLRFSQKVGEIIQYMSEGVEPPNQYYFYM